MLEVSSLLRALALEMDMRPDGAGSPMSADALQRERRLAALITDELRRAAPVRLGIDLPAEKRLRALCEAVLDDPARHATLDGWARDAGASPRTIARLFRSELGTSFGPWRQQVLLARALSLAARKLPMAQHRRRARLRQRQRVQRDGPALGRRAAEPLFALAGPRGPNRRRMATAG